MAIYLLYLLVSTVSAFKPGVIVKHEIIYNIDREQNYDNTEDGRG